MPLHNPTNLNERILAVGSFGCGKSTGWLQTAYRSQITGSDARFFVLDTDDAIQRMVSGNTNYSKLANLEIIPAYDWPEYSDFVHKLRATIRPHDWVVVDFIDAAWDAVQSHFAEQVFHQDIGQYFLEVRKHLEGGKSLGAFEGWTDWQVINKLYRDFANPLLKRTRANVYATARIEKVSGDEKDKELRDMYSPVGVRPAGQKHLGYQFHTVLVFSSVTAGPTKTYTLRTIKDRERPLLHGLPWSNFAQDYLVKIGGWKLA